MKQKIFYIILSSLLLVSCEGFHKEESVEYISSVINEKYDAVIPKTDESILQSMGRDSFITQLRYIRDSISNNIKGEIEYRFGGGKKTYSNQNGKEVYSDFSMIIVTDNEKKMTVALSYNREGKVIGLYPGSVEKCTSTLASGIAVILLIAFVVWIIVVVLKNRHKREETLIENPKDTSL